MHRIFLPEGVLNSSSSLITGDWFHQLTRVLRARPGMRLVAVCGDGCEYLVEIGHINRNGAAFRVIEKTSVNREPSVRLHVYAGILKANGLDEVLPGLVQLGVAGVTPMQTVRSVGRSAENLQERYGRIIRRATALSGRTVLMAMRETLQFSDCVKDAASNDINLFFWEENSPVPLKLTLDSVIGAGVGSIGVFIGPEGGFTADEAQRAKEAGFVMASLGTRILEARIAPVAATAAIMHHMG